MNDRKKFCIRSDDLHNPSEWREPLSEALSDKPHPGKRKTGLKMDIMINIKLFSLLFYIYVQCQKTKQYIVKGKQQPGTEAVRTKVPPRQS